VGAERDPDGFPAPGPDGDPEMIDVRRNAIDFRGESDRSTGDMNKLAVD
jgi:hypothetical protein